MKKSLTFILITIFLCLAACLPPEPTGLFQINGPTEIMLPGDTFIIIISKNDETVTSADIYLFKDGNKVGDAIASAVELPAVNNEIEVAWTVPTTSFSKNYRLRAYITGEDPSTSDQYSRSSVFPIGIDPTKFLIELVSDATYGDGTVGFGMWMSTNTDIITGTAPNLIFSDDLFDIAKESVIIGERDPETGEFLDQLAFGSNVGREYMEAGTYDWSPTLVYDQPDNPYDDGGTMYIYQYEDYAIDALNDYAFQLGHHYRCTISTTDNPNEDPEDPDDDYIPLIIFEDVS